MDSLLATTKSLADPTRLRILRILGRGPFTVQEMVATLGMGQSRISRHLKILAEAGLVEGRRDGVRVYYSRRRNGAHPAAPDRALAWIDAELGGLPDPDAAAVTACLERRADRSRDFFRRRAHGWETLRDRVMGSPNGYLPRLVDAVGTPGRVVDLGTGTGVLLRHLVPRVETAIGVDASPEMLDEARANLARWGLEGVDLRLGMLEHLPLGDGEVDGAVANMVLHHLEHPLAALLEARRVLVLGGRLVVAELAAHDDEELREALGGRWSGLETATLAGWMKEAGFMPDPPESVATIPGGGDHGAGAPAIFLMAGRAR